MKTMPMKIDLLELVREEMKHNQPMLKKTLSKDKRGCSENSSQFWTIQFSSISKEKLVEYKFYLKQLNIVRTNFSQECRQFHFE